MLKAGFREVYRSGFQSASIDTILAAANVAEGALYYHFESTEALGHAIVDEVVPTSSVTGGRCRSNKARRRTLSML